MNWPPTKQERIQQVIREAVARIDSTNGWGGYGLGEMETLSSHVRDLSRCLSDILEILEEK